MIVGIVLSGISITCLTLGLIVILGLLRIEYYHWLGFIAGPAFLLIFSIGLLLKACSIKRSAGGYSEHLMGEEAGGNSRGNLHKKVDTENPTIEVKLDHPNLNVEHDTSMDFSVEIEIDTGFDISVWGAKKQSPISWTGFYVQGGAKNDMTFDNLDIGYDGSITGGGTDVNGNFEIEGSMGQDGSFTFNKNYESYTVIYEGKLDWNSLKGTWHLKDQTPEEFSITLKSPSYTGWYEQGGDKNTMDLDVIVSGDTVFGTGSDPVGCFVVRGTYNSMSGECNFAKQYLGKHQVFYFGNCKDNERIIRGKWTIPDNSDGKFKLKQK